MNSRRTRLSATRVPRRALRPPRHGIRNRRRRCEHRGIRDAHAGKRLLEAHAAVASVCRLHAADRRLRRRWWSDDQLASVAAAAAEERSGRGAVSRHNTGRAGFDFVCAAGRRCRLNPTSTRGSHCIALASSAAASVAAAHVRRRQVRATRDDRHVLRRLPGRHDASRVR